MDTVSRGDREGGSDRGEAKAPLRGKKRAVPTPAGVPWE